MTATRQASAEARAKAPIPTDTERVLNAFRVHGAMTSDQVARVCGWHDNPYRARRRCSDLKGAGRLVTTGDFVKNAQGNRQAVLKIPNPQTQQEMF